MKEPAIRFKGYTDAWEQRKFGEITELKSASRVHREEWTQSGVPFYRSSDVMAAINGTRNEKAFISEELYEKLSSVSGKLEEGDVLVTGGGSVGNPYIVPNNEPLYTKDADLLWIKNQGRFDSYFIYEFFFSDAFRSYLERISHIGTIAHYTITQLSDTPISLPVLEEQNKIGDYFKILDNLITLHQRKCDSLNAVKKYMLQKMFPQNGAKVPEIRFKGFTGDWEQRKLGDVADICGGGTPNSNVSEYWDGDIDWYAPAEIGEQIYLEGSKRKITKLGLEKSSAQMLPVGTVLFSSRAGIGNTAILRKTACTNQGFQSIIPHENELDSYFIFSRTPELKKYGETVGAGSTFVEVSGKQMANMDILIPSLNEQKEIGGFFERMDNLIALHQRKCDSLKELKKFMLQNMFP